MSSAARSTTEPPPEPPKRLKLFSGPPEAQEHEPESLSSGLFAPPAEGQIHRTTNPMVANQATIWEAWNDQQRSKYQPKNVPADLRPQYVRQTSVPQFYADCQPGARWEPMGRKGRSGATKTKDEQALRRWVEGTRPDDWPSSIAWPGPSLEMIEGGNRDLMNDWVTRLEVTLSSRSGQPLKAGTIASTWTHLRTILNHAVKVQAITRFPSPSELPEDDETPRYYTDQEIESIWSLLTKAPLLKVALVVSCNTGPRAEDLFCLPVDCVWRDSLDRPHLKFEARKTGKKHLCPLAPCVLKAIEFAQRHASSQTLFNDCPGWLFPGLTNPEVAEPEDSPAAKRRAKKTRVIWDAAGLEDVEKPWQVGRSTCATRLATIDREAGKFMIGTGSKDVFTKSYAAPPEGVWRAALAVQQPACFLREFGG